MFLYAAAITISAFLLFLVEPIVARQILPWFGGSAAVWTTCMVFFQVTLLGGYALSDLLVRRVRPSRQPLAYGALLLASCASLPILLPAAMKPGAGSEANPVGAILLLLVVTIGIPFITLSATGPLLQAWFARRYPQRSVYRLYALSNTASLVALLGYPALVEPAATGRGQSLGWSAGYALFAALALAVAWHVRRHEHAAPAAAVAAVSENADAETAPGIARQSAWLLLATLGSVLLLATTTHITQNIASIPLLWVLPLALYLLSFVLCFDGSGWYRPAVFRPLAASLAVLMLAGLTYRFDDGGGVEKGILHLWAAIPLYLAGLFVACMFCHGELVIRKPAPQYLTRFYLMLALGGALGGLLVGVIAPLTLDWYWEFPAALLLLGVVVVAAVGSSWVIRGVTSAAALAGFSLGTIHYEDVNSSTVAMSRNFYGTLRVRTSGTDSEQDAKLQLTHGVIVHGTQYRAPALRSRSTTYYGEPSGIGRAIRGLRALRHGAPVRLGLLGLGVGTLSTYGRAGDTVRIYELNPDVVRVARTHFSFLADSRATVELALGDARLVMEREPPQRFDVLAVDAFSSDAIPVHLITREAAAVWARHVPPAGVIAYHISNRYLDLKPVVADLAQSIGRRAVIVDDDSESAMPWLYASTWVLITANEALIKTLSQKGQMLSPTTGFRPWTDDYYNLLSVLN
jgi:hypothetical protein